MWKYPHKDVWKLLFAALVAGIIFAAFRSWHYDDPFITYRYAYNLAHHLGFIYNPGERVLSTTTPLFVVLLAVLEPVGIDLPLLANLISALCIALGSLVIWDLARAWKSPVVGWAGLLLYSTFPLLLATIGSEMPFFLALCLGTFAAYAHKRYILVAVCAALATLTRPDAFLIVVVLSIDYLIQKRGPLPWRAIFLFVVLTLPWFLFAWSYFGSPIPATLLTKQHQGLMAISPRFAPRLPVIFAGYIDLPFLWLELGLCILGIFYMLWYAHQWLPVFAWNILYFLTYALLGVSGYYWYYAPLLIGLVIAIGLGIESFSLMGKNLQMKMERWSFSTERLSSILTFSLLGMLFIGQMNTLRRLVKFPDPRYAAYRSAGEWLKMNTPREATVGVLEAGILGYYSQRMIVDFAGLLQPEVANYLSRDTTYTDAAMWAVEKFHPQYLVLHRGAFPKLEQGYAVQNCFITKQLTQEAFDYPGAIDIYDCNAPANLP